MSQVLCSFNALHLGVLGLALDIAGALMLGWSFSAKSPEQIATESSSPQPVSYYGGSVVGANVNLKDSMIRQRAEARIGLGFLILGFCLQASIYFAGHGERLSTRDEVLLAVGIVVAAWVFAAASFAIYVRRYG